MGSVDGVKIAPKIVDSKTTYLQDDSIFALDKTPENPRMIWIIGTWKHNPVLKSKSKIKSRYCSKDQRGSTISEP